MGQNKVVIAGGAGFIGSHLCSRFLMEGWDVQAVDCFHTGQERNIDPYLSNPKFKLIRHDVTKPIALDGDLFLNFACPASPVHYQSDPIWTLKTSILGTLNMLGMAKRCKGRFFQASTSEVYGDPKEHPQRETYWGNVNPIGIRSCYDEGKRAAETLCFDYRRQHQLDIRVIRIFNTYGPNMALDDGRVVSNFLVQALKGEPLTIYGDGKQTRSFCFVDDLVEGIFQFATTENVSGPINLGNDEEFTMIELAEIVLAKTKSKSKIVYLPLPADDPKVRRPDLSLTKVVLPEWRPLVKLGDGVERSVPYFRAALNK
ncbi:MAG: SDR family oxidoreductase [Proteobacteria bacterium]|nr:SDR family oxidoreductase [Pseudomonadota bacterium]